MCSKCCFIEEEEKTQRTTKYIDNNKTVLVRLAMGKNQNLQWEFTCAHTKDIDANY